MSRRPAPDSGLPCAAGRARKYGDDPDHFPGASDNGRDHRADCRRSHATPHGQIAKEVQSILQEPQLIEKEIVETAPQDEGGGYALRRVQKLWVPAEPPTTNEDDQLLEEPMANASAEIEALLTQLRNAWRSDQGNCHRCTLSLSRHLGRARSAR